MGLRLFWKTCNLLGADALGGRDMKYEHLKLVEEIREYKRWCYLNGYKPYDGKAFIKYMEEKRR